MSGIDDDPTLPDAGRPLFDGELRDLPRVLGGRYVLEERLGVGGGAVVWRAFDEGLSRTVAVKLLRPDARPHADVVARLRREAATAGRAAHPGVVAVYDTGEDDGFAWLALEHVAGPTLLDVLRHHPRGLEPQAAAAVAEQAAIALGHAHARGLVHRDVKPSNLLVTADGVVKLADFGVAASVDDPHEPEVAGSRRYAPPEQLRGAEGADSPQVDVFALGVVLHECLTGRPAFVGASRRRDAGRELLAPRQVRPDVPRGLDAVVQRATRTDRQARYPDAAAMATELRQLVASDPFELVRSLVRRDRAGVAVPAAAPRSRPTPGDADPDDNAAPAVDGRGRMDWRWLVATLALLATTAALVAVSAAGGGTPDDAASAVADVGVPVTRVDVFDPYGSVGPGASEPFATIDDDATTAWRTPAYPVPLRSLGTPGLGVWLDVGTARAIDEVTVDLGTGGITIELLAANTAPGPSTTEADWDSLDRQIQPGEQATLSAGGSTARYWLLWITELEPDGETWQAVVTDLRFHPASTGTP